MVTRLSSVLLLFLITSAPFHANTSSRYSRVIIQVTGMKNATGIVGAMLFTSENGFPDEKARAYKMAGVKHDGKKAILVFDTVPTGIPIAVSVIHDENENQKMDLQMGLLPAEGFGFSRNPVVRTSAPRFHEASIQSEEPEIYVNIKLKYM